MGLSKEEISNIAETLIKASNQEKSEWLKIEKAILESHPPSNNENASSNVQEMWNQLHHKVEDAIKRMKKLED